MNTDHVVVQGSDLWCKACGQREPLVLPLPVKDLSHFVQTWAQAHEKCAEVDRAKVLLELRELARKLHDENRRLREAIDALPPTVFPEWDRHRQVLRRAAGLEGG